MTKNCIIWPKSTEVQRHKRKCDQKKYRPHEKNPCFHCSQALCFVIAQHNGDYRADVYFTKCKGRQIAFSGDTASRFSMRKPFIVRFLMFPVTYCSLMNNLQITLQIVVTEQSFGAGLVAYKSLYPTPQNTYGLN